MTTRDRGASVRSRRGLLVLGAAAVLVLGLPPLLRRLERPDRPQPIGGLPGFRRVPAGPASARVDPLIGLPDPEAERIAPLQIAPGEVCAALFPAEWPDGAVPVAVFTDIDCPYCRRMEAWLRDFGADSVAIRHHDLPLLGPNSLAAARAIGAAARQGAAPALRTRLGRTRFLAEPDYLTALAAGVGLDPDRLLADMAASEVEAEIARSLGLARLFGIAGTPAVVVGRTLAVGALTREEFARLLASEAAGRRAWPCA